MISFSVLRDANIPLKMYLKLAKFSRLYEFYYLVAESEQKFNRIADKDISFEMYMRKEKKYHEVFENLRAHNDLKINRINTGYNE